MLASESPSFSQLADIALLSLELQVYFEVKPHTRVSKLSRSSIKALDLFFV